MKILTLTSTLAISVSALSSGLALTSTLAIYVSALSSGLAITSASTLASQALGLSSVSKKGKFSIN